PAMFVDGDQLAADARIEAAPLWKHVVLDTDRGDPGPFVVRDGAHDIQRVPVAGVAVGDNRNADGFDHVPFDVELLGQGDEAGVGNALERGGNAEPARPNGVEACFLDQL